MLRSIRDTRRLLHAARVLSRHDALIPHEYLDGLPASLKLLRRMLGARRPSDASVPAGVRLARALESLGPAYIKLGQILATRPDIVGSDVSEALQALQDRVPPFPVEAAIAEIELALGKPANVLFAHIGDPVAAASIAQVHRAQTAEDPPRDVAVKVLRPGIEREFVTPSFRCKAHAHSR